MISKHTHTHTPKAENHRFNYLVIFLSYHSGDHTETMQVEYDPQQTNYTELLHLFWNNHDPTARNSPQYMSAIFYHDDEQKQLAEETMSEHQAKVSRPITTKILSAETFYNAEE